MDWARWRHAVNRFLTDRYASLAVAVLGTAGIVGSIEKWYRQFGDFASALDARERDARRAARRREALFERTSDCVARVELVDGEPVIRDANANFEAAFGPLDERRGTPLLQSDVSTGDADRLRASVRAGEPVQRDLSVETTDGPRSYQFRFAPVADGSEGYAIYSETGASPTDDAFDCPRRLLEQSQALADLGAWEVSVRDGEPTDLTWADEVYRIHGLSPDEDIDVARALECYHPEDRPRVREAVERAVDSGEPYDLEARLVTADGETRWVRTLAEPVCSDGEPVALRGVVQDVTTRRERQQSLRSLHDATQALLQAASTTEICDLVVDIADDLRGVDGVAVHLLADGGKEFSPVAVSPSFVRLCSPRPSLRIGDDESPAWRAFVDGETVVVDDRCALPWHDGDAGRGERLFTTTRVSPSQDPSGLAEAVRSGLFVPVGDHAVVSVLSTAAEVDRHTRRLVETLVSTTEAAFDRLDSESSLRERETQLRSQNERLNRQIQLTDIIRSVNQSLVDVDSRAAVAAAVCSELVASERIAFAWVGTYDELDGTVTPVETAGDGGGYLDSVPLTAEGGEPTWQTADSGTMTVVDAVVAGLRTDDGNWRRPALAAGFQSVVSVPIAHDGYNYGTLSVYAAEPGSLSDLEASVLGELGATVGKAINTVQTKQALYSDTATELTLRCSGARSLFARLSAAADCRVEFQGVSTRQDGRTQLFFTVTGVSADQTDELLAAEPLAATHRLVERTDDGGSFAATVSEGLVASTLIPQAASPTSMRAVDGRLEVTVGVAPGTDIRRFVDTVRAECSDVELLARRETERSATTEPELVDSLLASLSERQRQTLTTAYYSGYFEWPRETTGEEVAEMLGVSQPTVNRHLRYGQQRLLEQLFDSQGPATDSGS